MNPQSLATHQRFHIFLLALMLVLASALRIFNLSALGFWTDEFCTLSCCDGWGLQFDKLPAQELARPGPVMTRLAFAKPIGEVIGGLVKDEAHPPLYFLLLRFWENLWGDSESAVRSLNVCFSLASVALLFFVAMRSVGASAALWACLLMAVAEPQIQFSQEARNYMPVTTFSLLAVWSIQKLRKNAGSSHAAVLAFALLAMMLTHYFAAGVAAGLAIFTLTSLRGRSRMLGLAAFLSAAILFLLLWGTGLMSQWPHFRSNYAWISDTAPGHLQRVMTNLLRLPWRLIAEMPKALPLQIAVEILGAIFLLSLPILFIRRPDLRLWIIYFSCAVGVILAVDVIRSTAQLALLRYSLFATPALYVLLASAIGRGRMRFALPAIGVLIAMISLPAAYVPAWKIDFRTPVQFVAKHLAPGDGLLITGPDPIADGVMYGAFRHYLPGVPTNTAVLTSAPDAKIQSTFAPCQNVWIIWLWPTHYGGLPGFTVRDSQQIPYFAEMINGRFAK